MRTAIIGFVLGVGLLQLQAQLPAWPWWCLGGMVLLAGSYFWLARLAWLPSLRQGLGWFRFALALSMGFGMGFYWAASMAATALAPALAPALEGKDLVLQGTVADLPNQFEGGVRFQFLVERATAVGGKEALADQPLQVPPKVVLAWYGGPTILPGERWQLTVRLQRPHGNANPNGFDYELWLLEQGIRATGNVRDAVENRRLDEFVWGAGNLLARARAHLRERIFAALPNAPYAGVLVALVLGDQRAVSQADWVLFNQTGVGHLMSISGLHITMVAGFFAALIGALWRRTRWAGLPLPLYLPVQKVMALAAAVMALLYVALAGFGVPAQRTLYMLGVVALALWFDRISSVSQVLCTALGLVVVIDPWAVMWPGFWLSFVAVAMILYASTGRVSLIKNRFLRQLGAAVKTQYIVTLGLLPLSLLLFSQYSLIAPLANALAIPLVSFVVTPLALVGSIAPEPLCGGLLQFSHWVLAGLIKLLMHGVQVVQGVGTLAVWNAPQPSWPLFVLAMFGLLWMLAPRGWPLRWLGVILFLPLIVNRPQAPQVGQLWVTAFDVGQGTALLLETAQHRMLYDAGPMYSPVSDSGSRVILPYLKSRGIDTLDSLMISHRDSDHVGGALTVMQGLTIKDVNSSLEPGHPVLRAAGRHQPCSAGQRWQWDGVTFEVLHPSALSYSVPEIKSNARSCTLKVSAAQGSILLTGDIEAAQEKDLLAYKRASLAATVLVAPHHGSGTSSTLDFLQAVNPGLALFQVGNRNRYHHPKPEVFERYRQLGIARLRTDWSGAIELRFENQLHVLPYRQVHQRYWYGR